MEENLIEVLSPLALELADGETSLSGLQLMPLGSWRHPNGKIEITFDRAESFVRGFNEGVAGQRLPVLWIHSDKANVSNPLYGQAAGWITGMKADQKKGLLIDVEFTPKGADSVRNKEFAYLSAEYFDTVQLPHHATSHKDVMVGAALVNRPHLKGMVPILNEETGHQFFREAPITTERKGGGLVDPILLQLAKAAGVEIDKDAKELTDDQRSAITTHLSDHESEDGKMEKERDEIKAQLLKLEDPQKAKVRSLSEAGFEDEAKLLSELSAEREVRKFDELLPDGVIYSKATNEQLIAYASSGDPNELRKAFHLVVSGIGTVDTRELGSSGGAKDGDADPGDEFNALVDALVLTEKISLTEAQDKISDSKPELLEAHEQSMRVSIGGN